MINTELNQRKLNKMALVHLQELLIWLWTTVLHNAAVLIIFLLIYTRGHLDESFNVVSWMGEEWCSPNNNMCGGVMVWAKWRFTFFCHIYSPFLVIYIIMYFHGGLLLLQTCPLILPSLTLRKPYSALFFNFSSSVRLIGNHLYG